MLLQTFNIMLFIMLVEKCIAISSSSVLFIRWTKNDLSSKLHNQVMLDSILSALFSNVVNTCTVLYLV